MKFLYSYLANIKENKLFKASILLEKTNLNRGR
jgi:hypothetical protein